MNHYGSHFRLTVFGESHGPAIGVVIDGVPAGIRIDLGLVRDALRRRRPGFDPLVSKRREPDEPEVLSGLFRGRTTGAPLAVIIRNQDASSRDYAALRHVLRPGHADLAAWLRYGEWRDWRGGGHFSGRMTAPLVVAGAVATMMPWMRGVGITAHTIQIGRVIVTEPQPEPCGRPFAHLRNCVITQVRKQVRKSSVGCADARASSAMLEEIKAASAQGDSVGGIIECIAEGVRGGLGAPLFGSVEGAIAGVVFAIPAVKGIEFGAGFAAASMRGSEHNDPIVTQRPANGREREARRGIAPRIATTTNNAGGILGGITTGMPIVFRVAFKPTPSISLPQQTIDLRVARASSPWGGQTMGRMPMPRTALSADAEGGKAPHGRSLAKVLRLKGRHDPCIVPRALPVVEACAAIAIANLE